jgi:putative DNA primase/helicase
MSAVIDDLTRLLRAGEVSPDDHDASPFKVVDLSSLATAAIEPQDWYWDGYMPAGHVTLLAGHGGTGKSTLALALAACMTVGREFLGKSTLPARVLYFSGEDPANMVRGRLSMICRTLALDYEQVRRNLVVLDATEGEPVLFTGSHAGGSPTPTYHHLEAYVTEREINVLIVDNASEVFAADEIDRAAVRGFIRSLARLVRQHGGAVLLLAHVDKATSREGKRYGHAEAYSGSTAWHNSVRSRLALIESKPGHLELQHQKSNLGRKHAPLLLIWPDGVLPQIATDIAAPDAPVTDQGQLDAEHTRVLLALIHEFNGRGEPVATALTSPGNAAKLFSRERNYPRNLKPADVHALLREAGRADLIEAQQYEAAHRKKRECWALTAKGCTFIGIAPSAPSAPTLEVDADGAAGEGGRAKCANSALGGVGGERAQKSAQKRSKPARKKAVRKTAKKDSAT